MLYQAPTELLEESISNRHFKPNNPSIHFRFRHLVDCCTYHILHSTLPASPNCPKQAIPRVIRLLATDRFALNKTAGPSTNRVGKKNVVLFDDGSTRMIECGLAC